MKKIICLLILIGLNLSVSAIADTVVYNTKTGKYHSIGCQWAKKCTVNCINIDRKQAKARGGVPCKVCGGY